MAGGKLLLVGCGKMGGAMLEGWLERGLKPADLAVIEPIEASRPKIDGAAIVGSSESLAPAFAPDLVVLAVKPQTMDTALPGLRRFADAGATFLSIAAGKPLAYFRKHLGDTAKPCAPCSLRRPRCGAA